MSDLFQGTALAALYLFVFVSYAMGMVASFIHSTWLFMICLFLPPVAGIYGAIELVGRLLG
jgi:hypothetical protein